MDIYKQALRINARFNTPKGHVTTEQLFGMSLEELDALAVSLDIEHKESGKKSFLKKTNQKDKIAKLKFDVVLDVLNTKNEEMEAAAEALEIKKNNEKILDLISKKQDNELENLPIADLKKLLK